MKLEKTDLIKLLPQFMRSDPAVISLAESANYLTPKMLAKIKLFSVWNHIDDLTNEELDDLAWELNISWYRRDADIEVKRTVIKESDLVHAKLGTKWAVEQVVRAYFGSGKIREWFEYDGDRHHRFKVISSNPSLTNERLEEFLSLLEKVKRKSAILDGILITLTGEMPLHAGIVIRKRVYEKHYLRASVSFDREIDSYGGIILKEYIFEQHVADPVVEDFTHNMSLYYGNVMRERIVEKHSIQN